MELVQQGRDLLRTRNYKAALGQFERAIDIDATNPYSDYFVARAHYFLQDYRQSWTSSMCRNRSSPATPPGSPRSTSCGRATPPPGFFTEGLTTTTSAP